MSDIPASPCFNAFLLRHGRIWGGPKWSSAHRAWVERQRFDEPALQEALDAYRGALEAREAELRAAGDRLMVRAGRDPLAPAVARLGAYRGIAELTALTLAAEVIDWHRFPSARAFMGFTGLVPAEYSSGARTRCGSITKAGSESVRTALVESAQAYRHQVQCGTSRESTAISHLFGFRMACRRPSCRAR